VQGGGEAGKIAVMHDDRPRSTEDMGAFEHLMYRSEQQRHARSMLLAVMVLDRAPDWPWLVETYERVSRMYLRFRQRVVTPIVPLPSPQWAVDPDFDITYHVRRLRTPEPGTMRQLFDLAEMAMMTPLDPTRPLWETTLVEGLEDGRAAIIQKVNHAVTDGMGGVQLMALLFSTEREATPPAMPPVPVSADVTPRDLAQRGLASLPRDALAQLRARLPDFVRSGIQALQNPRDTYEGLRTFLDSARRVAGPLPAPSSPLLARRGIARRFEVVELPLDALKRSAKTAGGSVNDAYLAAVGGALRHYHDELGVPIDALPAAVPISVRAESDAVGGNRWAGARLAIPTGPPDADKRIRAVREVMLSARSEPALHALDAVAPVLSRSPEPILEVLASVALGTDVQISNIPGPPMPLFIAGSEIVAQYPFGPLPGPAMMVTMMSYAGTCYVGINYDPMSVTHEDEFRAALVAGFDEVVGEGTSNLPLAKHDDIGRR
jgi:diacylglycerol O-acyltransferase